MPNRQSHRDGKANTDRGKPRPKIFRALGKSEPPKEITIQDESYCRVECFKHDSWAATAVYQNDSNGSRIVCKFNRQQSVLGIPMRWLGRRLAERETFFLKQLADVPNVPNPCGPVQVDGVVQKNVAAHDFVDGGPLQPRQELRLAFFRELRELIVEMHERGFAYVDLHKPENVIVGDDGKPHLIDFQISFRPFSGRLGRTRVCQAFRKMLVGSDLYHLRKLRLQRHRGAITEEQYARFVDRPSWINMHRTIAQPLRQLRRKFLVMLNVRRKKGYADTEHNPEVAVKLTISKDPVAAESPRKRAA